MDLESRASNETVNDLLVKGGNMSVKLFVEESWINHSVDPLLEESLCGTVETRLVSKAEAVACVISILTVLENVAILAAIMNGPRSLRKPPYWFIASLAAADLLTGVEVVLAIFVPVGTSPLSRIVLKGMAVVTFIASINSLLFVSFDRYMRIAHQADYSWVLTRRNIVILIFFSWLVSFLMFLILPLLGVWSCAEQHCCADNGLCVCKRSEFGSEQCDIECSHSFVPFSKNYLRAGTIYFVVAIACMVMFYIALFQVVKKKTFGRFHGNSRDSAQKRRDVRLAKTLIITLGAFVICWLPIVALFIADLFITTSSTELSRIFDYALVPSVINSLLNPIIYSIRLPRMRNTLKSILLPCVYGKKNRFVGSAWTTNTSVDRSLRKTRKRAEKPKSESHDNSSISGNGKSHNCCCAASKATFAKSQTSDEFTNALSSRSSSVPTLSATAKQ